tara:strand:- start:522 stop:800 length:279 start_codon:yes stop_codon:yes gene_type:complete
MNSIQVIKETRWKHTGTLTVNGTQYDFEGIDISPYSEYLIWLRDENNPCKIVETYRLRSTYLYKDDDKLLEHMIQYALPKPHEPRETNIIKL